MPTLPAGQPEPSGAAEPGEASRAEDAESSSTGPADAGETSGTGLAEAGETSGTGPADTGETGGTGPADTGETGGTGPADAGETGSAAAPDQERQMAESFGTDPRRYDRIRPRYPQALIDWIVAASPGPEFLVVGSGTGIDARQFQAAGGQVLGVEPDLRMASFGRQAGVAAEVARFEEWDPAGRQFDAVVAGQAWHWVDPAAGAAQAARVLRPGGVLAVFWNVSDPSPAMAAAFAGVHARMLPGAPVNPWARPGVDAYQGVLDRAVAGMRAVGLLGEPVRWQSAWPHRYTRDEWLDLLPTQGVHTRLTPGQLAPLLTAIGAAIDARGAAVPVTFTTLALLARRAGGPARTGMSAADASRA